MIEDDRGPLTYYISKSALMHNAQPEPHSTLIFIIWYYNQRISAYNYIYLYLEENYESYLSLKGLSNSFYNFKESLFGERKVLNLFLYGLYLMKITNKMMCSSNLAFDIDY